MKLFGPEPYSRTRIWAGIGVWALIIAAIVGEIIDEGSSSFWDWFVIAACAAAIVESVLRLRRGPPRETPTRP
jgi:hypothetical protein